jgi:NAD kinase
MKLLLSYHKGYFENLVSEAEKFFRSKGHNVSVVDRECLTDKSYTGIEFIVVIGGDGTFLRTSHLNTDIPMVGINPFPEKKEGFFMKLRRETYKSQLEDINRLKLAKSLLRLETSINGKKLTELCLNEVFIGDSKPYNMFNYDIEVKGKREFQRSSGVLIGTPAGSHAWIKSAGGKVLDLGSRSFQYLSRELYENRLTKGYKLRKGILGSEESIKVIVKSPGMLIIDSVSREYMLKVGDVITICVSFKPLSIL